MGNEKGLEIRKGVGKTFLSKTCGKGLTNTYGKWERGIKKLVGSGKGEIGY